MLGIGFTHWQSNDTFIFSQFVLNIIFPLTTCKDNARKFERGEHCMQRRLYEHFNLPGQSGFLNDISVTLIDKADPKDPTKQEDYWIHILKSKAWLELI